MAQAMLNSPEALRTSWKITLDYNAVLDGAREKLEFHQNRLKVWEKALEDTKVKIRERGVILDESVLEQEHSVYSNTGRPPAVALDNLLVKDLNEANNKINEHKDKVRSFQSWVFFLSNANGLLDLTLSDYLYFFGK